MLLAGALVTLMLGLSAHVLTMTVLHVPFPSGPSPTGVLPFLNEAATALAVLLIYQLSELRVSPLAAPAKAALLFLLVTTMAEKLLRYALMNGFVTTAWSYYFIKAAQFSFESLVLGLLSALTWWAATAPGPRVEGTPDALGPTGAFLGAETRTDERGGADTRPAFLVGTSGAKPEARASVTGRTRAHQTGSTFSDSRLR